MNHYLNQKFSSAIRSMASSPKSLQKRIAEAYICHLVFIDADEAPEDARFKFSQLKKRLASVKSTKNEGDAMASIQDMATEEAIDIANNIVYIENAIKS